MSEQTSNDKRLILVSDRQARLIHLGLRYIESKLDLKRPGVTESELVEIFGEGAGRDLTADDAETLRVSITDGEADVTDDVVVILESVVDGTISQNDGRELAADLLEQLGLSEESSEDDPDSQDDEDLEDGDEA